MYCIKCGKEIPDGEENICEECKKKELEETKKEEKSEKKEIETAKLKDEKKETEVKKETKTKTKRGSGKKENKKTEKTKNNSEKKNEKKDKKSDNDKKYDKKTIIVSTVLIAAIVILAILIVCVFAIPKLSEGATTIGNIRNYGYTTIKGNWIYYVAPNEDSTEIGIFKIKTNGEEKQELYMGDLNILSLNIKGDYLYFIGIGPEEYSENDASDNKIYKMKTDGTDLQVINDNEFHNACLEMYVIDNAIYYIGTDQNIYKMKLDGSDRMLVSDNGTGYLGITDKYIFYNFDETGNEEYVTYMMDLDGSNPRPIIEGKRLYSIDIKDDYVYYTNTDKELFRTKIGSNEEEKYDTVTAAYNLNLNEDYLYYLNYEDETNIVCVYRVKTDDKSSKPEKIKEMDNASQFINVVGDYVYYMDYNDVSGFINLVKKDGSGEVIQLYILVYEDYYETSDTTEDTQIETTEAQNTDTTEDTSDTSASVENVVDTNTVSTSANTENNTNVENTASNTAVAEGTDNTVSTNTVTNSVAN
mgnify:CR=1 FL=1